MTLLLANDAYFGGGYIITSMTCKLLDCGINYFFSSDWHLPVSLHFLGRAFKNCTQPIISITSYSFPTRNLLYDRLKGILFNSRWRVSLNYGGFEYCGATLGKAFVYIFYCFHGLASEECDNEWTLWCWLYKHFETTMRGVSYIQWLPRFEIKKCWWNLSRASVHKPAYIHRNAENFSLTHNRKSDQIAKPQNCSTLLRAYICV